MNCPKCKNEISRSQFFNLIYSVRGVKEVTCEDCGHKFPVKVTFSPTAGEPKKGEKR